MSGPGPFHRCSVHTVGTTVLSGVFCRTEWQNENRFRPLFPGIWFYFGHKNNADGYPLDPHSTRLRVVHSLVNEALRTEKQRHWYVTDSDSFFHKPTSIIGYPWLPWGHEPLPPDRISDDSTLHGGILSMGHFRFPKEDELEPCPLCAVDYTRDHFIRECVAVCNSRWQWPRLGIVKESRGLVLYNCCPLGNLLLAISEWLVGLDATYFSPIA